MIFFHVKICGVYGIISALPHGASQHKKFSESDKHRSNPRTQTGLQKKRIDTTK